MRNQWHGDNRDLVKWGAVFHLVEHAPTQVIYVPMLTADDPPPHSHRLNGKHPLPLSVVGYFRDVAQVARLPWPKHVDFSMVAGTMEDRPRYFADVLAALDDATAPQRRLVLLDPDTGIAPRSGGNRTHVLRHELADVYGRLRKGDLLAVYQHRWRDKGWFGAAQRALAEALRVEAGRLSTFTCSTVASDVALLVAEKDS